MTSKKQDKQEFHHESLQDPASLARYLRALTEGFESGELSFKDKDGDITLNPKGLINFRVEASQKRSRRRLSIKFSWRESEGDKDEATPTLEISSNNTE